MVAGTFADENALGIATHQRHDLIGDQAVINHHVSLLDLLQAFQGQQASVTRSGTHQYHFTALLLLMAKQLFDLPIRQRLVIIGQRLRQAVVGKQFFPKTTACADVREVLFYPLAQ
ncbi:hypothetical protein D3C72_1812470 [compost metagenome]